VQPVTMPVCAYLVTGFQVEKFVWQASQAAAVGMCVAVLLCKAGYEGVWQLMQEPGAMPVWP
jgi:hypothetical protein